LSPLFPVSLSTPIPEPASLALLLPSLLLLRNPHPRKRL
jgi:hypothetical protein